jgi:hypothetical protein
MSRFTAVPSTDYSHWTVCDHGHVIFGPVTELEAKAIARELNANPEHPWS